jgi:hypothetical protein
MKLSVIVAIVAGLSSVMVCLLLVFLAFASPQREPYLKRVAKKYSIPPLNLR